jgi:hypothetical protein
VETGAELQSSNFNLRMVLVHAAAAAVAAAAAAKLQGVRQAAG